jgi:DNA-directed RNA polymerase subunit RPC12/RpoP
MNSNNSDVLCPDCNSQDIQEIVNDNLIVNEGNLGKMGALAGCSAIVLGPFSLLFLLFGKRGKSKTVTQRYFVCRSCGKEFKDDNSQK